MENFWIFLEKNWKILESFGTILGVFWDIFGTFLEHFGKLLGNCWEVLGTFLEQFNQIFGEYEILFFFKLKNISVPEIFFN